MFSGITNILAAAFQAVAGYFGWNMQRDKELNTPEMQKNKEAEIDQKDADENSRLVQEGKLDEIRKKGA